jgi:hypothetical protein
LYGAETWDTSESTSEIPGHYLNVVLKKDEIYFDPSLKNEEVLHRINKGRNTLYTLKRRKANWFGHFLRRNCLVEGKIEWKRGRGRRRNQLLDKHKNNGSEILKRKR